MPIMNVMVMMHHADNDYDDDDVHLENEELEAAVSEGEESKNQERR